MKRRMSAAMAVVVACGMLAGCGGSKTTGPVTGTSTMPDVSSTTSTTPTPVSSSASGSGAVSTSPSASASGTPNAALVAEATRIFKAYEASLTAWQGRGGSAVLPPEFLQLTSPPLTTETQQLLANQKLKGWYLGQPLPVFRVTGTAREKIPDSLIALTGCIDASRTPVVLHGKKLGNAESYRYVAYFHLVNGSLRYYNVDSQQVETCG